MVSLKEIGQRIHFYRKADRIGPDIPLTHWRLYFPTTMEKLCKKKFAFFGEGASFRPGAYAVGCSKIHIGQRVIIRPGTMLFADPRSGGAGIIIEDDVLIGSCVHFYNLNHRFLDVQKPIIDQGHSTSRAICLRRGCWVGAGVIILSGVEIGQNSVIGAGSVVTKSVPPFCVAVGNPARIIKRLA